MRNRHLRQLLCVACLVLSEPARAQSHPPVTIDAGIAARAASEPAVSAPVAESTMIEPPAAASRSVPAMPILAGTIRVDGADDLPHDEMTAAISPYIGHRLSAEDLQDLLTAVSGIARANGYLFAHSAIPAQTIVAGVLHVALNEGEVDEVRVIGPAGKAASEVLGELEGHAPKRVEVERRLMLAGDLPGISIGRVRYLIEKGKGILVVPVTRKSLEGSASFDNRGLRALGPERARLAFNMNGLLSDRDQLTFQGLATPFQPRELVALYGRYAVQPDNSGTEFSVYGSFGATRSGGAWRSFGPKGESDSVGVSLAQPLLRGSRTSLWVMGQGDRIGVDEWWNGTLVRRDQVTSVGLSINGYTSLAGGTLRAGGGITQGVLALGATRRDYPLASRFDAGSDFTMTSLWATWEGEIAGPFSARLATVTQLSSDPLPAVEQLTIGGPIFGRGYNFSERTGDRGALASAELRARLLDRATGLIRSAQIYSFGDAGHVSNLRGDFGTGSLYSAGLGTRLALVDRINMEFEAAFPLNKVRYDSNDKSPRISFSVTSLF